MDSDIVIIKMSMIVDAFLYDESNNEKDEMTYSMFLKSIGLKSEKNRKKQEKDTYRYTIIDREKWMLGKIKYGI